MKVDGDLQIDFACPEIWIRGKRIDLTKKEWDLLCYMAERRCQVITFEELRDNVWAERSQKPPRLSVVKQYVMSLRRKLGDDPSSPRYILSKWGVGYRFMVPENPSDVMARDSG